MAALVLACDVTTKWGVYAHGTPVDVESTSDGECVVILADLPRNRLFARVPRHVVRRAAAVPTRVPRPPVAVADVAVSASAWSDVKEAS